MVNWILYAAGSALIVASVYVADGLSSALFFAGCFVVAPAAANKVGSI